MSEGYLTHPVRLVVMAGCMFVLGLLVSPWFFILMGVFLIVWGVGFLEWVFEGWNGKL